MTAKILRNCLENYPSSALVRIDFDGKKIPLLTYKHKQPIDTVGELQRDLENYTDHFRLEFAQGGNLYHMLRLEYHGVYVVIVAKPVGHVVEVAI